MVVVLYANIRAAPATPPRPWLPSALTEHSSKEIGECQSKIVERQSVADFCVQVPALIKPIRLFAKNWVKSHVISKICIDINFRCWLSSNM
jgi:hypothetical protein